MRGDALDTCGIWWPIREKVGNVLIVSTSSFVSHVVILQGCVADGLVAPTLIANRQWDC